MTLHGGCHCGDVALAFETSVPAAELELRADQCSFCRRHGARTASDPRGRVTIVVRGEPIRHRFAHRTADFIVCARCGVYVAAVMTEEGGSWATVNVNTLEPPGAFARAAVPVSYDAETETERRARRRARWTPAVITRARDARAWDGV